MKPCQGSFHIFSLISLLLDLDFSTTYGTFAKSHTNPHLRLWFLPLSSSMAKTGVNTFNFFLLLYERLQVLSSLQWCARRRTETSMPQTEGGLLVGCRRDVWCLQKAEHSTGAFQCLKQTETGQDLSHHWPSRLSKLGKIRMAFYGTDKV